MKSLTDSLSIIVNSGLNISKRSAIDDQFITLPKRKIIKKSKSFNDPNT